MPKKPIDMLAREEDEPKQDDHVTHLKKRLMTKEQSDALFVALIAFMFIGTWSKFSFGTACFVIAALIAVSLTTEVITLRRIRVLTGNTNAPIDGLIEIVNVWIRAIKDKLGKF